MIPPLSIGICCRINSPMVVGSPCSFIGCLTHRISSESDFVPALEDRERGLQRVLPVPELWRLSILWIQYRHSIETVSTLFLDCPDTVSTLYR